MPDTSAIPIRPVYEPRQAKAKAKVEGQDPSSTLPSVSPAGPRKLIRPHLPLGVSSSRYPVRMTAMLPVQTAYSRPNPGTALGESSHAEAFYFQKQIQSQTSMVFVLEDGEHVEGTIEWYDRGVIKVRRGNVRTLIYKAGIKYLYKAADSAARAI